MSTGSHCTYASTEAEQAVGNEARPLMVLQLVAKGIAEDEGTDYK